MEHLFTDDLNENGHTLVLVSNPSASVFVMVELAAGPPPGGYIEVQAAYPHDKPVSEATGFEDKQKLHHIDGQAPRRVIVKASNGTSVWLRVSDKNDKTQPGRYRVVPIGT